MQGEQESGRGDDGRWVRSRVTLALGLALGLGGCAPGAGAPDAGRDDGGAPDAGDRVEASAYCERAAPVFCPFYLRCGRIAEPDLEACRRTFAESCEAQYEPRYVALAARGLLELSASGLAACAAHLAEVPCEHHLLDLEGPCRRIWRGTAGAGSACGVGVESFVCAAETTCALDLSLCGTCDPAAATGQTCGDGVRCVYPDLCVDGVCAGPALPGESCDASQRCISGASCDVDICVARQFVGEGQACDAQRRCQYRTTCLGGTCHRDALLGETCGTETRCASGVCDAASGRCVAFTPAGESCSDDAQCLAGRCETSGCAGLVSACLGS